VHTLYSPTTSTPLITVTQPFLDQPQIIHFHLHRAAQHHDPGRIYKSVAEVTQSAWDQTFPEPSTLEQTLQALLSQELAQPLHSTTVIAPLLANTLYKHLHTHCTLNKPLWYERHPGPWHSTELLHSEIGATTGPISAFVQNNLILVHAAHSQSIQSSTDIPEMVMECLEAFRLNRPPLRLVVISNPAVAAAIIAFSTSLPQPRTNARILCTLSTNAVSIQSYDNGKAYDADYEHITMNPFPFAVTVIDTAEAPPYDPDSLLHDLHTLGDRQADRHTSFPTSFPRPLLTDYPHLQFLIPGPRPTPPGLPTQQNPTPDLPTTYTSEDNLHTLATIMGCPPDKYISRYLKDNGQHAGNSDEEMKRVQRILSTLRETTLKAHARLYGWHCDSKYGTQSEGPTVALEDQ
jgi:hypothetical protein